MDDPLARHFRDIATFQVGSVFMINMFLVVISTQFSITRKKEMEKMAQEEAERAEETDSTQDSFTMH